MATIFSRAFLDEIREQQRVAIDELAQASVIGDDLGVVAANARLRDLEELARRNDAWPGRELSTA